MLPAMTDIPPRLAAALQGRYRMDRPLGEGGMATVYLAEDVKHGRRVAIKVLKPELAAVVGAERFLAEIETTAQLQHPHILPLFDSGEADGFLYYVMPYVEGETLRDRLDRERQFPVDDAVALALKVASALEYAHENGVLHRDIKPANILLSRGEPLVADFGIALALGAAGGRLTETGLSLGTPYYMSPEQATGDQYVGPPSDVYALACVLYEMLVGDPPHQGSSAQAVLAKIIAGDPARPRDARPSIPAHVDAALRKALEKLPADRFGRAEDFARALRDPAFRHGDDVGAASAGAEGAPGFWKPLALSSAAVALASLGLAGWLARDAGTPGPRDVGLPYEAPLQAGRTFPALAIAPDGSFLIYEGRSGEATELWYRSLTDTEARPIRGTGGAVGTPMISPNGRRVAFASGGELKIVDMASGAVTVAGQVSLPNGGTWLDDELLVLVDNDGRFLRWFDAESGQVRQAEANYCLYPTLLGDGEEVLCGGGSWKFAFTRDLSEPVVHRSWTRSQDTSRPGGVVRGAHFRIVDGEYLVYLSVDGALTAAPIQDLATRTVGRSVALIPGIRREAYTGAGQFDIARDGTLVYGAGLNAEAGQLVRVSREGVVEPLKVDPAVHLRFRESPDGRRLATVVETVQGQELRVYDLQTGSSETALEAFWIGAPLWSPDGTSIVYRMHGQDDDFADDALYLHRLNSPDPPRRILYTPEGRSGLQPASFLAPDSLLVGVGTSGRPALVVDPTTDPATVDSIPFDPLFMSLSPDRRWLVRQNQGTLGVFLHPWPALDRQYTVSQTGNEPQWLADGQLAFYDPLAEGQAHPGFPFYRVTVDPSRNPPMGEPTLFFQDPRFADTPGWSYAPARDGGLIYLQGPEDNVVRYVRVIPGWVDQMKAAVAEANR